MTSAQPERPGARKETRAGFLLSRQAFDTKRGIDLSYWLATESGPVQLIIEAQEAVCFFPAAQSSLLQSCLGEPNGKWRIAATSLLNFDHEPVMALYAISSRVMGELRRRLIAQGVAISEADVRASDRYLMERFISGSLCFEAPLIQVKEGAQVKEPAPLSLHQPRLKAAVYRPTLSALSIDIETDLKAEQLFSIACYSPTTAVVFMVGSSEWRRKIEAQASTTESLQLEILPNERAVLNAFLDLVQSVDPDVLIGWNVVNFDLRVLQALCERLKLPFALGRKVDGVALPVVWREAREQGATRSKRYFATIPGRCALDGIELMRSATYSFESFSLENVARQLLGRGKLVNNVEQRGEEIATLFATDKLALARYNLEDCALVWEIFEQEKLLEFAIEKSLLTGLPLDRYAGSVAALDFLYLPRLHRKGYVAPAEGEGDRSNVSPGGFVLESQPGIFDDVVVLDFKSLYPSIMRTFHIDPLALARGALEANPIGGFDGGQFARDETILPDLIATLWQARDKAKATNDAIMSQAIKIIMNSFYGVLGTPSCRFLDTRLVSSITKRGHQIIQESQRYLEDKGFPVIYGDTDSVFVLVPSRALPEQENNPRPANRGQAIAVLSTQLADEMTQWWRDKILKEHGVPSYLEMEFETHFSKFLMPTIRGTDAGSKKRYAGLVQEPGSPKGYSLVFKGLESVRSDWSPLARDFQRALYECIFLGQPYAELIFATVASLRAGELDDKLVFTKRLRRRIDDYEKNVPPHIQAARKARERSRGEWQAQGSISYLMTHAGPEPVGYSSLAPDYEFYIERQLEPVADAILGFLDDSMAKLFGRQLGLF